VSQQDAEELRTDQPPPQRSLVVPLLPGVLPPGVLRKEGPPPDMLRQWSDALAAAGLYPEALDVHPALERVDVVRQVELALLAGIHSTALDLLAELAQATTERTRRTVEPLRPGVPLPPSPWLDLLGRVAELFAGSGDPAAVRAAQEKVRPSAGLDWIVALAAVSVGDLAGAAGPAGSARAGGCRDLRMLTITAADLARREEYDAAIALIGQAQRIALPDEDPAALTVNLLQRCDLGSTARTLALTGSADQRLAPSFRADWRVAAAGAGVASAAIWSRRLRGHGRRGLRRAERRAREAELIAQYDLTCRCYGSGGWIGPDRSFYLNRHLHELLPAPVAGLDARLMVCRATSLTFLDLEFRQITLPVPAVPAATAGPLPDEACPTPGMGVSLGAALPA